jgi:hypothetical protein
LTESILCKWLYQIQSICSIQSPQFFNEILHRDGIHNPKVHVEAQMTLNSQSNTEWTELWLEGVITADFKLHFRAIAIKSGWDWHKNQWDIIEEPDINPHSYNHLILTKGSKISNDKMTASLTNGHGKTRFPYIRD